MIEFKLPPIEVEADVNPAEIPWGVQHVNAPKAWNVTKGKDIVVAILDTGIDATHPDLAGKVIGGRNFTGDYNGDINNFSDNNGHGTHVAGTIGAVLDGNGVVGVAPEVKYVIGKVLSGNGAGSYSSIISGIKWATQWQGPNGEKVRIISMSLGGPADVPALHQAIQNAVASGISVVCAAGNDGDGNIATNEFDFPGAYPEVIEVGAIDQNDIVANFSDTNPQVDVVAPGVNIVSTMPGGKWAKMSGTSMATPHVAGFLALVINAYEQAGQKLTEAQAFGELKKYVRQLSGNVNATGNGVIDFGVADLPVVQPNPEPTPAPAPVQPVPQPEPEQPVQPSPSEPAPEQPNKAIVSKDDVEFYVLVGPFKTKDEAVKYKG